MVSEIDEINDFVYPNVNNGVYRCGFATTQQAYEEAVDILQKAHDLQPDQTEILVNLERARAARDAVRLGQEARLVRP